MPYNVVTKINSFFKVAKKMHVHFGFIEYTLSLMLTSVTLFAPSGHIDLITGFAL